MEDVSPAGGSLLSVFEALSKRKADLTEITEVFNRREVTGGAILLQSADAARKLEQELGAASERLREQSEIVESSVAKSWERFTNVIEEAGITAGENGLGAVLKGTLNLLSASGRLILGFGTEMDHANQSATVLSASLRVLAIVLAGVIAVSAVQYFIALARSIVAVRVATTALTAAMAKNPIGLIAVAASLAVGTILQLSGAFDDLTTSMGQMEDRMRAAIAPSRQLSTELFNLRREQEQPFARAVQFTDYNEQLRLTRQEVDKLTELSIALRREMATPYTPPPAASASSIFRQQVTDPSIGLGTGRQFSVSALELALGRGNEAVERFRSGLSQYIDPAFPEDMDLVDDAVTYEYALAAVEQRIKEVRTAMESLEQSARSATDALQAERIQEFNLEVGKMIQKLQDEIEITGLSERQRAHVLAQRELMREAQARSVDVTNVEITLLRALTDQLFNMRDAAEAATEAERNQQAAIEDVIDLRRDLTSQLAVLQSGAQGERRKVELQLEAAAEQGAIDAVHTHKDAILELVDAIEREKRIQNERKETLQQIAEAERTLADMIERTTSQTAAAGEVQRLRTQYNLTYEEATQRATQLYQAERALQSLRNSGAAGSQIKEAEQQLALLEQTMQFLDQEERMQQVASSMGEAFRSAFNTAAEDVDNLGDAIENLFRDVRRQALDFLVTQPLTNLVTGGLSSLLGAAGFGGGFGGGGPGKGLGGFNFKAMGAAYSGGVDMFASGGIFGSPTGFLQRNGRIGVLGEAGDEGIMPLKRTRSGKLGVIAEGGGGGDSFTINMTIQTPNVESMRAAADHIAQDAAGRLRRYMRR
jgi:hypothetical protein